MKTWIKLILIILLSPLVIFLGLLLIGGIILFIVAAFSGDSFGNLNDEISVETSIEQVRLNTGLDIEECEFLRRDIYDYAMMGTEWIYEIQLQDDKILEQIVNDTLWVKDDAKGIYQYHGILDRSDGDFMIVTYDENTRTLSYSEERNYL